MTFLFIRTHYLDPNKTFFIGNGVCSSGKSAHLIVFGLNRPVVQPHTHCTRGHTNHYTTAVISSVWIMLSNTVILLSINALLVMCSFASHTKSPIINICYVQSDMKLSLGYDFNYTLLCVHYLWLTYLYLNNFISFI